MSLPYLSPFANHLWQSTVFAGVAALLTLAMRKNRARVRHWVWLTASCKFLVPLSLLIALGAHIQWRTTREIVRSDFSIAMAEVSQPFTPLSESTGSAWIAPVSASPLPTILWAVWACGFLGISAGWWVRWRRFRTAISRATPVNLELPLPVMCVSTLLEPGVFGIFRPVLVLPEGIFNRLPPAQLEAVIAHELCHVRHRDNLIAAIHMFVETAFWFHPLVWWIGSRMVEERERACDQEVLQLGSEPRVYAEGILNVCKFYVESPLGCVSGVTGSDLKQRVQAILANRMADRLGVAKKLALALAGMAAFVLPVVIGMLNAPAIRAQSATVAKPKFEVASIKTCKVEGGLENRVGNSSPGRLSLGCDFLADANHLGLIQRAYVRFAGGHPNPIGVLAIRGGAAWIHSEGYKIDARAEGHPSGGMMMGPMLQALLEDRFKLRLHRATEEQAVYELRLAKDNSKLKPFKEGSCVPVPSLPAPVLEPGQRYCDNMISARKPSLDAEGVTLTEFSKLLNLIFDRPVIDKTEMTGKYDFHLTFSRDEVTPGILPPPPSVSGAASDPTGPTIFASLQEQLGLKLVRAKGPVEVLVIDHVEKPSEN